MLLAILEAAPDISDDINNLSGDTKRRNGARSPTRANGKMRRRGSGFKVEVQLLDLSVHGCRLRTTGFAKGDQIFIAIAHLAPILASICWTGEGCVGVEFEIPLHPAIVAHLASPQPH